MNKNNIKIVEKPNGNLVITTKVTISRDIHIGHGKKDLKYLKSLSDEEMESCIKERLESYRDPDFSDRIVCCLSSYESIIREESREIYNCPKCTTELFYNNEIESYKCTECEWKGQIRYGK